jgi:hypothetical protein
LAWVDRAHVRLSRKVLLGWIPQRWMRARAPSIASHLAAQHRSQHIRRSKSSRLDFPRPLSPVSTRCKKCRRIAFQKYDQFNSQTAILHFLPATLDLKCNSVASSRRC